MVWQTMFLTASAFSDVKFTAPTKDTDGSPTAVFALDHDFLHPAAEHCAGLLLVDGSANEAISMDYKANLSTKVDPAGNIQSITLTLPRGMVLPEKLDVYVIPDVFPMLRKTVH